MFETIDEIKTANAEAGYFWFSPETLRFFSSRISTKVYGGRYFVSSEKEYDGARRYTVREARSDGSINTVSKFGEFTTLRDAESEARRLALPL